MGWGPNNPEYLAMTDLDILREVHTARFYQLLEEGTDPGTEITEVHGDEAFNDFVTKMEDEAEERRLQDAARRGDFEEMRE